MPLTTFTASGSGSAVDDLTFFSGRSDPFGGDGMLCTAGLSGVIPRRPAFE
jgi:hypothetical protein